MNIFETSSDVSQDELELIQKYFLDPKEVDRVVGLLVIARENNLTLEELEVQIYSDFDTAGSEQDYPTQKLFDFLRAAYSLRELGFEAKSGPQSPAFDEFLATLPELL